MALTLNRNIEEIERRLDELRDKSNVEISRTALALALLDWATRNANKTHPTPFEFIEKKKNARP